MCLVFLLSTTVAYGDILSLTDEEIAGKVIKSFNHDGQSYAQIATDKEIVWVKMPQTRLVKGKTYAFYPAYSEYADYVVSPKRERLKKLLYTIGIVDKKIDHEKYSFRGIKIGTPMSEVSARLKEMGYKITESDGGVEGYKLAKIEVPNFMLGRVAFDLSFHGDTNQKLSRFFFQQTKQATEVDKEWVHSVLALLNRVFVEKFGNTERCQDIGSLYSEGKEQTSCEWFNGDYSVSTDYTYVNGAGVVSGRISSISRSLLAVNKYTIIVRDLKKSYQDEIKSENRRIVNEGAESF